MTLKMRLVRGHVLDADRRDVTIDIHDPIHHQERITMRQQLQYLENIGAFQRLGLFTHRSFLKTASSLPVP